MDYILTKPTTFRGIMKMFRLMSKCEEDELADNPHKHEIALKIIDYYPFWKLFFPLHKSPRRLIRFLNPDTNLLSVLDFYYRKDHDGDIHYYNFLKYATNEAIMIAVNGREFLSVRNALGVWMITKQKRVPDYDSLFRLTIFFGQKIVDKMIEVLRRAVITEIEFNLINIFHQHGFITRMCDSYASYIFKEHIKGKYNLEYGITSRIIFHLNFVCDRNFYGDNFEAINNFFKICGCEIVYIVAETRDHDYIKNKLVGFPMIFYDKYVKHNPLSIKIGFNRKN